MAKRRRPGTNRPNPFTSASSAERAVRAAHSVRLDAQAAHDKATMDLARAAQRSADEGASAEEIGSWMTSPDKPQGLTRQYVYKLMKMVEDD